LLTARRARVTLLLAQVARLWPSAPRVPATRSLHPLRRRLQCTRHTAPRRHRRLRLLLRLLLRQLVRLVVVRKPPLWCARCTCGSC
jgi:hypothetical protein